MPCCGRAVPASLLPLSLPAFKCCWRVACSRACFSLAPPPPCCCIPLRRTGKVAEGIAAYERALALVPRQAEALYNLGVAYTEAGQIDKALFM